MVRQQPSAMTPWRARTRPLRPSVRPPPIPITTPASPPTATTTINGRWTRTTMDGLGRTIKVEAGHDSTTESVTDTEYDSCGCSPTGKMKRTSLPHAPGATQIWTTYTYDGIGRTLTATTAGTETTSTTSLRLPGQYGNGDRRGGQVEKVHHERPRPVDAGQRTQSGGRSPTTSPHTPMTRSAT